MSRIKLILIIFSINFLISQTTDDLKRFMDTYEKLKVDQEANEVVKDGIKNEKMKDDGPIKILVKPSDVTTYYKEKMKFIYDDLKLNDLFELSDSTKPLTDLVITSFSLRDSINFIDNINISPNYILGYGDEIVLSVWGEVEQYEKKIIERDGTIYIDNVGLLYLGGKTILNAKNYI